MRSLIVFVVLVLLPFQLAWAAAGAYCYDDADASHFGHHEHKYTSASTSDAGHSKDGSSSGADCELCHLGASPMMAPLPQDLSLPPPVANAFEYRMHYRSYVPPPLDRPNRLPAA